MYQGIKYTHGDQVITSEPCLNCTCKKGVLLCFLKVCPTLMHTLSNPRYRNSQDCQVLREPGQCCPVMKCESTTTTTVTGEITTTGDSLDSYPTTMASTSFVSLPSSTVTTTTTTTTTSTTTTSTLETSERPEERNNDDLDSHLYYHSNHKEPSPYSTINFHGKDAPFEYSDTSDSMSSGDLSTKASTVVQVSSAPVAVTPSAYVGTWLYE